MLQEPISLCFARSTVQVTVGQAVRPDKHAQHLQQWLKAVKPVCDSDRAGYCCSSVEVAFFSPRAFYYGWFYSA